MNFENKVIIGLLSVLVIMSAVMMFGGKDNKVGYAGDITTFNSSMALNSVSATTSLAIGGDKAGRLCINNGATFTIITFASGSTTPAYATSTTCSY